MPRFPGGMSAGTTFPAKVPPAGRAMCSTRRLPEASSPVTVGDPPSMQVAELTFVKANRCTPLPAAAANWELVTRNWRARQGAADAGPAGGATQGGGV